MASPIYLVPAGKVLFLLFVAATLTLEHGTGADEDGNNNLARPGCPDKCGDTIIPYPFGIRKGCYWEGFRVYCDQNHAAYLSRGKTLKVLEINLSQGEVRIQKGVATSCNYSTNTPGHPQYVPEGGYNLRPYFSVSNVKNKFTAIGCATTAIVHGENHDKYTSGCVSFCNENSIENSTQCNGIGCCQTSIPDNLRSYKIAFLMIGDVNYSTVKTFSPCSYAFVVEQDRFKFNMSYAKSTEFGKLHGSDSGGGVPMVLNWVLGNKSCDKAKMTKSSYACRANNSKCINAPNGSGYLCNCSQGYEGNPYLVGGCKDINECDDPSMYPCKGQCSNTIGGYNCSCPLGTQSEDPKITLCTPLPSRNQPQVKLVIGVSVSFICLVVCAFSILAICQKRKLAKERERFFKQNGGHILYQQILSQNVDTVMIFTLEDLKNATSNFDKSRELGKGGQGIVYRGILSDNKVVAVKRSKIVNMSQAEEFVQEIIILSQTNHKNVVRLLGCCLEVEVPILVYEFIPNGTLFHFIHSNHNTRPISLEVRLRIAQESAEALAYLHLSINRPIVHGDVKSMNILLDENHMAKVTDFGASRMLPKDDVQFVTMVQGTLGYLDPEYLQERQLTEKSDVYSFGVVLLELITRKKAIYSEGHEEGKNLASSFHQALKENRAKGILDTSIMCVGTEELLLDVVELGRKCLSVKGEERPSMAQVADSLKAIRTTWRELLLLKHNETELLNERSDGVASVDLYPSMYITAPMLGMEIETPCAENASSTCMTSEYV
ncbi:unnamed protein product [Urochloa decumbens]|uniref:Protein kinase domain-containing protein n=1 Tax=Urochloa decumbens TaxID=240449 RepID=A0ABC9HDM0_9POAL